MQSMRIPEIGFTNSRFNTDIATDGNIMSISPIDLIPIIKVAIANIMLIIIDIIPIIASGVDNMANPDMQFTIADKIVITIPIIVKTFAAVDISYISFLKLILANWLFIDYIVSYIAYFVNTFGL